MADYTQRFERKECMCEVDKTVKSFINAMEDTRDIVKEQDEWFKSHSVTNDYGCDNSEYHWLKKEECEC